MTATNDVADQTEMPRHLYVASTLCWALGLLMSLGALATPLYRTTSGRGALLLTATGVAGIGLCVAGKGLRTRRRYAGWLALVVGCMVLALQLRSGAAFGWLGALGTASMLLLVMRHWSNLH